MNWNRIEGGWKRFKGAAMARWGELSESRLDVVAGKRELRTGIAQEARGSAEEAVASRRERDLDIRVDAAKDRGAS